MGNKHFKLVTGEIDGETAATPDALYQAYNKGRFRYQFQRKDGTRSRIMRCSSLSELLWLTEKIAEGASVIIGEPVPA